MHFPAFGRNRKDSMRSVASSSVQSPTTPLRPTSPTFSTTTTASNMNLVSGPETIITRADLRGSVNSYEELVKATASFRSALGTLSHASSALADAMEKCARLKGVSDECAVGLQAASGLHHLIANHEQVLARVLHSNVEIPLTTHLEEYKAAIADRSAKYEQSLLEKSKVIRKTEIENMNIGKRRQRDLNSFRAALTILQAQVNDLDRLKGEYYQDVLSHEDEVWDFVLHKVSFEVRSSLDVYDRITAKSSDPHLEPLLMSIPDPFDSYGPQKNEDEIFSILPPLAIMGAPGGTAPPSTSPSPMTGSPELEGNLNGQGLPASATSTAAGGGLRSWMDLPVNEPLDHHGRRASDRLPPTTSGPSSSGYHSEWADVVSPSNPMTSSPRRFSVPPAINASAGSFPPLPPSRPTSSPSSINSLGSTSRSPTSRGESKLRTVLVTVEGSDDSDDTGLSDSTIERDAWGRPTGGSDGQDANGDKTPKTSAFRIARSTSPSPHPRSRPRSMGTASEPEDESPHGSLTAGDGLNGSRGPVHSTIPSK